LRRGPLPRFSKVEAKWVIDYIRTNIDRAINLLELAELVQLSPRQFLRVFANTFGTTPHQYILNERIALAKELITTCRILAEISMKLGFASPSHFSGAFRKLTGMSPRQYRRAVLIALSRNSNLVDDG
jgi:AraC family transcriptional regulator